MSFWKWWTSFIMVVVITVIAQVRFGIFEFVMLNDPTYITSVVVFIALITTLMIGYKAYKLQFKNILSTPAQLEPYWFTADAVMSVGMVGTLIGFLMVLTSAFADIDTSSQEAMKEVIGELAAGMGVALLTSLAGLISSILLKSQLVMLENSQESIK
jgi:hypothetical protein